MNTSWSCRVSTQFEASAHRAVIRKELGGVKRRKQLHHEVVVDILRSAASWEGQNGLRHLWADVFMKSGNRGLKFREIS